MRPPPWPHRGRVAPIATGATLAAPLLDQRLEAMGFFSLPAEDAGMTALVLPAIALVKVGRAREGG
jgi:hypothetical protein